MRDRIRALRAAAALAGAWLVILALGASVALAAGETVVSRVVGSHGRILVAGSNNMTVYTFTDDVANSGVSTCTGRCLVTWPALTVAAGQTPTADPLVTGKLGTITRADNGALQVTYNGLPLYFFQGDKAPGDTTGVYAKWELVTIVRATGGGLPPTSTADAVPAPSPAPLPVTAIAIVTSAGLGTFIVLRSRFRRSH